MQNRFFIMSGSALAALAVILGALGAHALKSRISPEQLVSFETGVKYQMYHALALILIYVLQKDKAGLDLAGQLIFAGCLLFSFSIYLLSTRSLMGMEGQLKFLGPITPIGGVLMIAGWVMLLLKFLKD